MNKENLKSWCITNLLNSKGKINGNKLRTDYKFYHDNIDKFNLINNLTNFPNLTLGFKVMCIVNDVWSNPVCPECGNLTTYRGYDGVLFSTFCSNSYGQKSEITRNKRSESVKQAYVERGDEIVKASKQTKLERYNDENYVNKEKGLETWHSRSSEEKELVVIKRRKTRLKRYGSEGYNNKEKAKDTMLIRYGVEHFSQSESWKEQIIDFYDNLSEEEKQEIIEKKKETCMEKYGVDSYSKTDEFKDVITNFYDNLPEEERNYINNKIKETKLERYGSENYNNLNKAKETCLLRYGVDNYSKTDEFKEQINIINSTRTDKEWYFIINKIKESQMKKYGSLYIQTQQYRELKESIGDWIPLEQKSDKKLYYYYVNKITENNYIKYKDLIDPNNLRSRIDVNENSYHLDHMFSRINGFKNCILPWVIGHPCNLEMIYCLDNAKKGKECSHSIEELYFKIDNFTN